MAPCPAAPSMLDLCPSSVQAGFAGHGPACPAAWALPGPIALRDAPWRVLVQQLHGAPACCLMVGDGFIIILAAGPWAEQQAQQQTMTSLQYTVGAQASSPSVEGHRPAPPRGSARLHLHKVERSCPRHCSPHTVTLHGLVNKGCLSSFAPGFT